MITNDLNHIADLLYAKGTDCDFGCDESCVESIKQNLVEIHHKKGVRIVKDWTIWQLAVTEKEVSGLELLGLQPMMMYATNVIFDLHSPYMQGTCVRTTLLRKFSENYLFETKNTVYLLVGKGTQKTVDPMLAISIYF